MFEIDRKLYWLAIESGYRRLFVFYWCYILNYCWKI